MRILDVGILAEVFSTFRCNECDGILVLYEEEWNHGWQTFFRVKCQRCHSEHATFPSSGHAILDRKVDLRVVLKSIRCIQVIKKISGRTDI